MVRISVKIQSNKFPALAQRIPERTGAVVEASMGRVVASCKQRSRVDTGDMRDSWAYRMSGPADGEVYNDSDHVLFNEYGTRSLPAQPMLAPSIDQERPAFIGNMAKLVSELG